ncbi:MAG: transcription-repair coupling factor [Nitrospirae bacterium]|nr:transcription-repair coupling factor [Nitrospirota bacterium]
MKTLRDIIQPVLCDIQAGHKTVEVSELWGAAKAFFLFGLQHESRRPVIIVTATEEEAETLAEDLRFFSGQKNLFTTEAAEGTTPLENPPVSPFPDKTIRGQVSKGGEINAPPLAKGGGGGFEIFLFPAWGVLPFEADSPDSRTVGERMRFLYSLISGSPGIFVAPVTSLMQKLPPWELFVDSIKTITTQTQINPDGLIAALVATGYESASLVTRVGEFSRRGGIIDFFSPLHENPVRMEFFGDAIESLREFDPETQRSTGEIREAVVLPVRELILNEKGIERFKKRLQITTDENGFTTDERINQIQQGILPPGGEFLAPFFYEMESLFHYLPVNSLFALIEPDDLKKELEDQIRKREEGRHEEKEEGRILPEVAELYLDRKGIEAGLSKFPLLNIRLLGSGAGHRMDTKSSSWLSVRLTKPIEREQREQEQRPVEGTMAGLVEKLKRLREFNRVALVCGTDEAAARLKKLFMEYGLGVALGPHLPDQQSGPWPIMAMIGRLSDGFAWQELGVALITEEEIFGRKVHSARGGTPRSKVAPFLSTFKELKPGDFVVHTDYGVGEYQGLTHLSVDEFETDFLTLRYEPDAKLYVPLYSLDKVQKYIGIEGSAPKLDKLGAPAWARTKEKARKDILEMAQQLVAIYAAREAMQRPSFSPPDNLYREFESAFPYEETPDQQKAIEDVLADMQRPRPMDRVVCGDVGYGKTEVALRAAFKAVEDGYQAAVLVPTTLLADQHFRTFSQRLAPFSVRVDMLSRFRTKAEQKETLKGLKSGTVDMVIGTHRLIQKDILFKNLGLLVVDEEHKFGVKHKERIKEFKKLVDVLTLTATPIPRTLHMSLAGIRDLSIIQTPPLDRQAIQVVLARFGKRVVREAIAHELARNGQVFFVHNRVQGIERMADFIRNLVPEARVGVAHGQLKEDKIEDVMTKFLAGNLNVLVTTTIIESGIDIPTANTIIINRADRFGLADLYQIKGRVGRSREKAYAYLLAPADEALSDTARKRLRAIQELSELGAGFRIAAQDLETRGAGNLLGKQQSGHIAAVGIDLYTQMMEEAMAELRGETVSEVPDTLITMRASAFIPEDYISDVSLRLAAYKEISSMSLETELKDLADELRDRYGELPEPTANLLEIMSIKLIAKKAGVARIDAGKNIVNITFTVNAGISPDRVMTLLKRNKGRIKLVPEYTLQIALPDQTLRTASEAVKKCLQELV